MARPIGSGSSEALVPQGLPQGERQRQVASMRQAGLPLEARASRPVAGRQRNPLQAAAPSGRTDVFAMRRPTRTLADQAIPEPPATPADEFLQGAQSSVDPMIRFMADRLEAER